MNPASLIGHVAELLRLTDGSRQPPDKTVSSFLKQRHYLGGRDRRVITESAFGMIRNRRYLEALLEEFTRQHPEHAEIEVRQTRYLLLYLIFTAAPGGEWLHPGHDLPAMPDGLWSSMFPKIDRQGTMSWIAENADLGFLPDDRAVRLGVRYSFQDWMVDAWIGQFGADAEPLLRSLNEAAHPVLRVNTLKATRDECRERLRGEGVETDPASIAPDALTAGKRFTAQNSASFREGLFELQDEGSQLVSLAAGVQPDERVVDVCAGAGGKSLHLAALMNNTGSITAMDVDERRLHGLMERAKRAGVRTIQTRLAGAGARLPEDEPADLVLVDAPCTGVGTIRRNPGLKWSVGEADVERHAVRQRELLLSSAGYVRPGGRLVYATCSLFRRENEDVVASFLDDRPEFETAPAAEPVQGLAGDDGFVRVLPHRHGTDGFFIAVLRRRNAVVATAGNNS